MQSSDFHICIPLKDLICRKRREYDGKRFISETPTDHILKYLLFMSLLRNIIKHVDQSGTSGCLCHSYACVYHQSGCWTEDSALSSGFLGFSRNCGDIVFQKISNSGNAEDSLCFPFWVCNKPKTKGNIRSPRFKATLLLNACA